jgi:hypothetical protein
VSAFLEGYGEGDARRERRTKRIVLAVVALSIIAGVAAYIMRDFREIRQANRFAELVKQKQFEAAYRLWGCDKAKPCRDYAFAKFMADWGQVDISAARATDRNCSSGVIRTFEFSSDNKVYIWVDKSDRAISFAPFEGSCRQPVITQQR